MANNIFTKQPTKEIREIEILQDELELIKARLQWLSLPLVRVYKQGIVKATAGILGKRFPHGIVFENEARRSWPKHFK
ncbi:MAG: hypothetical protein ABIJ91_04945 [Candidatus Kuenenbacteria bacterium]